LRENIIAVSLYSGVIISKKAFLISSKKLNAAFFENGFSVRHKKV